MKSCQFLKYNTDSDNRLLVYYFVICMSPLMLMVFYMATEMPKWSPHAASVAVSFATWPYVAPPSLVRKT